MDRTEPYLLVIVFLLGLIAFALSRILDAVTGVSGGRLPFVLMVCSLLVVFAVPVYAVFRASASGADR